MLVINILQKYSHNVSNVAKKCETIQKNVTL